MEVTIRVKQTEHEHLELLSIAIRHGIIFSAAVNALSPINEMLNMNMIEWKLKAPIRWKYETMNCGITAVKDRQLLEDVWSGYRGVCAIKSKKQADIVFMKRTEKILNSMFENWCSDFWNQFIVPSGMAELVQFDHTTGLYLHRLVSDERVKTENPQAILSRWLRYEVDQGPDMPGLFMLIGHYGARLAQRGLPMATLLEIPDLNRLNAESIGSCRLRMQPYAKALSALAVQWWQVCAEAATDLAAAQATILPQAEAAYAQWQPVVNNDPDMRWCATLIDHAEWPYRVQIMVCPHNQLMEVMEECGLILDPTLEVMRHRADEPVVPALVPVLLLQEVQASDALQQLPAAAQEQTDDTAHGLRTLDID